MPTNRRRVGRTGGGIVTDKAVALYREGIAIKPSKNYERHVASRKLAEELRVDVCLPCLLDSEPVFLLAVMDEGPYRATWHELKAQLEAANESA